MPIKFKVEKNNFTAGELSPWLRNRTNLDRYQNGVKLMRNFVCIPEGGATRRPGTRFVLPLKNQAQVGTLIPFRYSGADSYMLVLNGGAIRFLRAGGFIESSPGVPYEVAMPWAAADLDFIRWAQEGNTAWLTCRGFEPRKLMRGTSHTDWTLSLYRPTGGPVKAQNLDTTKTILASGTTGSVTLMGTNTNFQAGHVGSVWRLDESDLSLIPNWKANETVTIGSEFVPTAGATIGDVTNPANAFDANIATFANRIINSPPDVGFVGKQMVPPSSVISVEVRASKASGGQSNASFYLMGKVGAAPANAQDGVTLGSINAVLTTGLDNVFTFFNAGDTSKQWDYQWIMFHWTSGVIPVDIQIKEIVRTRFSASGSTVLRRYNGNVYQAIAGTNTGLTPPTHTEGDVQSETGGVTWRYRHGPYGMVRITAVSSPTLATGDVIMTLPDSVTIRPTYRWFEGAWSGVDGWPEGVLLVDRGLLFWRGPDFWLTTVGTTDDFEVTTLDDSAIAQQLRGRDGALPNIMWALDNGVIVMGCRDNEVIVRAPGTFEPLTGLNIRAPIGSRKGSAAHVPAALEEGCVFIGRSGKRLFYSAFDPDTQKLEPSEISISGRHLLKQKVLGLAWQPDPWNVLWGNNGDGEMVGVTINSEHKVLAMHSHNLGGFVEAVKSVPSSDEGVSDVYIIIFRVIGGLNHRYVEQLGPYFTPAVFLGAEIPNAKGAWFFDSALAYAGPATGTISGLTHLIGETVGIIANNAAHARKPVLAGGVVNLDRSDVTSAVIGLPIDARIRDLPRNIEIRTAGSTKGKKKRAANCVVDVVDSIGGTISCNDGRPEALQLTGGLTPGAPPPLFTGAKRASPIVSPLQDEAEIEIVASEGMPFTLTGLMPEIDVTED